MEAITNDREKQIFFRGLLTGLNYGVILCASGAVLCFAISIILTI